MNNDVTPPNLGEVLRLQRIAMHMTLQQLSAQSKVSPSHLGRIEKGTRFPSARVLQRLALPLGIEESELLSLAGFLSEETPAAMNSPLHRTGRVDPYVAKMLGQEPPQVQHTVLGILSILKSIARNIEK